MMSQGSLFKDPQTIKKIGCLILGNRVLLDVASIFNLADDFPVERPLMKTEFSQLIDCIP